MSGLPNGDRVVFDPEKVADYVLNPDHPVGRHKARVFLSALGLTRQDAAFLEAALAVAARTEESTLERTDVYGSHYSIESVVAFNARSAMVRSLWVVRAGEDFPRFVSAFVR